MEVQKSWAGTTTKKYPYIGKIEWARPILSPPFQISTKPLKGKKAAFRRGLKYEQAASAALIKDYSVFWQPARWFEYLPEGCERSRYCQVDGLLDLAALVICEIKLRHTPDSFFQLNNLYLPVVQAAFPERSVALCEIVKWYDPLTAFPCQVELLEDLRLAKPHKFSVHILSEK